MSRLEEWTRETEAAALERLRAAAEARRPTPVLLVYTRQSVSDFDAEGRPRGPSLDQQLDAVLQRPDVQGLAFEHFQDAARPGTETPKRPGELALTERSRAAPAWERGPVAVGRAARAATNSIGNTIMHQVYRL